MLPTAQRGIAEGLALRRRFAATGIAGYVASVSLASAVVLFLPLVVLAQAGAEVAPAARGLPLSGFSLAELEDLECHNKARALLTAAQRENAGRR